jgi:hypothetical protein
MNTHRRVGPTVSDAQITSEQRLSRIRTLKIFGGLHIGLGLVCGILSVVGTILSVREKNRQCDYNGYYSYYNSYYGYYYYCPGQYYSMLSFIMYIVSAAFSGWVSEEVSLIVRNGYSIRSIGVGVARWKKLCPLLRLCLSLITLLVSSNFSR